GEPLFNGKDLTGWGYKSGATFDGKTESDDKRYAVKEGILVVNPGTGIKQLWTTRQFPRDFELRLEFRAAVNAHSGRFVPGAPRPATGGTRLPRGGPVQAAEEVPAAGLEPDRGGGQGRRGPLHLQRRSAGRGPQGPGHGGHRAGGGPRADGIPQPPHQGSPVT